MCLIEVAAMGAVILSPLFPMVVTLCVSAYTGRHLKRNAILLYLLIGLYSLSFAPVIFGAVFHPESRDLEVLLVPMSVGALLFLGSLVYLAWECVSHLSRFAPNGKPDGERPSGKVEFRCFGCGEVIKKDDEVCSSCGWTWK
jgi:hypothetical protein